MAEASSQPTQQAPLREEKHRPKEVGIKKNTNINPYKWVQLDFLNDFFDKFKGLPTKNLQ